MIKTEPKTIQNLKVARRKYRKPNYTNGLLVYLSIIVLQSTVSYTRQNEEYYNYSIEKAAKNSQLYEKEVGLGSYKYGSKK